MYFPGIKSSAARAERGAAWARNGAAVAARARKRVKNCIARARLRNGTKAGGLDVVHLGRKFQHTYIRCSTRCWPAVVVSREDIEDAIVAQAVQC